MESLQSDVEITRESIEQCIYLVFHIYCALCSLQVISVNDLCNSGVRVSNIFLNQQFITRGVKADHGSYFVTKYRMSKLHEERKGERNKTRKGRKEGEEDTNA